MSFFSPEFIIQFLIAVTSAGGISAIVGAYRDKRKADAQAGKEDASAAEIIEGAAGRSVLRLEKQVHGLDLELEEERKQSTEARGMAREAKAEVRSLQAENEMLVANQLEHEAWDKEVMEALTNAGISIRQPPALQLPRRLREGGLT